MATITGLTIEDFEKLPDALAVNHELVDGELVDVSGNVPIHNWVRDYVIELAGPLVRAGKLGRLVAEQEYAFGENAHGPDVSFVRRDRLGLFDARRRVQLFVPDLAIEVVSLNDTFTSLITKANRYIDCGTEESWILSIDSREVYVYRKGTTVVLKEHDMLTTPLLPGFSIRVGELFDRAIQI